MIYFLRGYRLEKIKMVQDYQRRRDRFDTAMKLRNASRESLLKPARRFYKKGML
jgi:hypothetical protein